MRSGWPPVTPHRPPGEWASAARFLRPPDAAESTTDDVSQADPRRVVGVDLAISLCGRRDVQLALPT